MPQRMRPFRQARRRRSCFSAFGSSGSPLDTAAAVVSAPVTMPIKIFEARSNDHAAFLERAKGNRLPLPPLDPESRKMADSALRLALDQGETDKGLYWEDNQYMNYRRAVSVTVLSTERVATGSVCRDVLVEAFAQGQPTGQRVSTLCRHGIDRWKYVLAQPCRSGAVSGPARQPVA